jgi:hypothetical protein
MGKFIPGDATKGSGVRLTHSERTSRTKKGVRSVQAIRLGEITKRTQIADTATAWLLSPEKAGTRWFPKESAVFHGIVQPRQTAG